MTKEEQLKKAFEICKPDEVVLGFGGTFTATRYGFSGYYIREDGHMSSVFNISGDISRSIYLAPADSEAARINWLHVLNLKLANDYLELLLSDYQSPDGRDHTGGCIEEAEAILARATATTNQDEE